MTQGQENVEKELNTLFSNAALDLQKGEETLKATASLVETANRFIKVCKRFFDIFKLFEEEFGTYIDVVAAMGLLHFSRSCYIVSHILMNTDYLKLSENPSIKRKMTTLTKRATRKVYKNLFLRQKAAFYFPPEEYKKNGFFVVLHEQNGSKRNYGDELCNLAFGLKNLAAKLNTIAIASGIVDPSITVEKLGTFPSPAKLDFAAARSDLLFTQNIMKDYYSAVIKKLDEVERLKKTNPGASENYDDCLLPLMEKYELNPREVLRGEIGDVATQPPFLDVSSSEADVYDVSKLLAALHHGPEPGTEDL